MSASLADLHRDYSSQSLLETDVDPNPVKQFERWWQQAVDGQITEPNAMTLATSSADGMPSARIVLLKGFDERGFIFYTNYESFKAMQLEENPRACLVFFWKELERQVRITGLVMKASMKESDQYFLSRPAASQLGAWASPQSRVIESRNWLDEQYLDVSKKFQKE